MGVRVEVVSFRGNTSSDLIEVADVFTDISQLARVEKGERSGRRVASEDDLSMTAVPEKETDNGVRRRRGEGRTRSDRPERGDRADRTERPPRAARPVPVRRRTSWSPSGGNIIALPGERLSRAAAIEDFEDDAAEEYVEAIGGRRGRRGREAAEVASGAEGEGEARRRRRRRGGRGRGRGRRGEGEGDGGRRAGEPASRSSPAWSRSTRQPDEVIDVRT